jgi:Chaperone of endosialidase
MKLKLLAAFVSLLAATAGLAQTSTVPSLLSYQGRVTDSGGNLIGSSTPANRTVKFQLYTASSGGTSVWAETQTVTISGGEFSVLIGNGTGISGITGPSSPAPTPHKKIPDILNASTNPANVNYYLGVTVDDGNAGTTDAEISPRQQLVAGAYSLRALVAESVASSAVTTGMIADSNITTGKIADSNVTSAKIADSTIVTADLANSAVTAAKIDTASVGLWSVSGSNVYRSSGSVGVGTSSPTAPLNVVAGSSTSPDSNGLFVVNPTNSANQMAIVGVRTAGSSAGNPFFSMDVNGVTGWSMGIDTADSQKFKISNSWSSLSSATKLTVTTAGNVGIGQTGPGHPLSFADSLGNKISLFGQNTSHYGIGMQSSLLQFYSDSAGADIAFGYGSSANFTERMRVKGNGYVGIGTNGPGEKLTINSGWLRFDSSDTGNVGYMATSDYWKIYGTGTDDNGSLVIQTGDNTNEPIIFKQQDSERMRIHSNGYVGIGTNSPRAPLEISGQGSSITHRNDAQGVGNGWSDIGYVEQSRAFSLIVSNNLLAESIFLTSDERVKVIENFSDAEKDLETLLKIKITDYHYKDSATNGSSKNKKVIAQQVEKVFPQAVSQLEGSIPDIFATAAVTNGWVQLATNLSVGEKVKLITEQGEIQAVVTAVRADGFQVDTDLESGNVFVYGRFVKDFRVVDYDAISMLNVSATQQLNRDLDTVVAESNDEFSKLRSELDAKSQTIKQLESRLEKLEARLSNGN